MKILLLNDTRINDNPGCHATVGELLKFISSTVPNSYTNTLSLGAEYGNFSDERFFRCSKREAHSLELVQDFLSRLMKKPNWDRKHPLINNSFWNDNFTRTLSDQFKQKVNDNDLIIINMEGTIHHNSIGGLTLMSMALYCKQQGKRVFMVNGSYQAMDEGISKRVLPLMDFVSVREPRSQAYLSQMGIDVELIPDFAFMSDLEPTQVKCVKYQMTNSRKCLYTPGVLGAYPNQKGGLSLSTIVRHFIEIRKAGYEPYFLKVEQRETRIEKELKKINIETLNACVGADVWKLRDIFAEFELIVTGRFHIGIFGILTKTTTLFLPSNTFKTEGLLEMINAHNMMIKGSFSSKKLIKHIKSAKCVPINKKDMNEIYAPLAWKLKDV